jgi:hypothetical protein
VNKNPRLLPFGHGGSLTLPRLTFASLLACPALHSGQSAATPQDLAAQRVSAILTNSKDAPALTVGVSENFIQNGGMIGLCLQENKIRFNINLKAAQRANLRISSRLLLLAKSVIAEGKTG